MVHVYLPTITPQQARAKKHSDLALFHSGVDCPGLAFPCCGEIAGTWTAISLQLYPENSPHSLNFLNVIFCPYPSWNELIMKSVISPTLKKNKPHKKQLCQYFYLPFSSIQWWSHWVLHSAAFFVPSKKGDFIHYSNVLNKHVVTEKNDDIDDNSSSNCITTVVDRWNTGPFHTSWKKIPESRHATMLELIPQNRSDGDFICAALSSQIYRSLPCVPGAQKLAGIKGALEPPRGVSAQGRGAFHWGSEILAQQIKSVSTFSESH